MDISKIIVDVAKKYVGQKEIPENQGFMDQKFQELMDIVGWERGYAWCALFAELVWKEAYSQANSMMIVKLDKLFSAGSVQTFLNFKAGKGWETGDVPRPGAVVIWQNYRKGEPLWTGHTGIVTAYDERMKRFKTVEGNTNISGGREADMVAERTRRFPGLSSDFRLKGFVYPKEV